MIIAVTIIVIVFIICVSFLIGLYMDYCKESRIKMFSDSKYDEHIQKLEKRIEELENEA